MVKNSAFAAVAWGGEGTEGDVGLAVSTFASVGGASPASAPRAWSSRVLPMLPGVLEVLRFPPPGPKDMCCSLTVMSKLSVVCEQACDCAPSRVPPPPKRKTIRGTSTPDAPHPDSP